MFGFVGSGLPKNRTLDSAEKAALTEADKQLRLVIIFP